MRIVPAIILAIAIILAPVLWFALPRLFQGEMAMSGPGVDSGARLEIELLHQQVEAMNARIEDLSRQLQDVANQPIPQSFDQSGGQSGGDQFVAPTGPNTIKDDYAQVVLIANRRKVNDSLAIAGPSFLAKTFGLPRQDLNDKCQSMTNPRLADKLVTENVGPIRVRMLKPAVESLRRVFENVRTADPDLYARISTAGSLCVRLIRGSLNSASTHGFGLAVDLNIDGRLDTLGDGRTQVGLTILADFFKAEGWVWGAAWRREDSMHFEVSRAKLQEWIDAGQL